jgi:hypothetical protein
MHKRSKDLIFSSVMYFAYLQDSLQEPIHRALRREKSALHLGENIRFGGDFGAGADLLDLLVKLDKRRVSLPGIAVRRRIG